jgi:hypothetical protein
MKFWWGIVLLFLTVAMFGSMDFGGLASGVLDWLWGVV